MRIVGGKYRGRALATPKTSNIRPTTDRTRESLFNILSHGYSNYLEGAQLLELFAGTGAVGIEALSRGAEFVLFVENSIEGRGLLRQNIDQMGLNGCTRIFKRDATKLGTPVNFKPFNFVFADPPYGKSLGEKALTGAADEGWFSPDTLVLLEERADIEPKLSDDFQTLETRTFGDSKIWFYKYVGK